MKKNIKRDAISSYKELRRRSPMPFLLAGLAFLLYGLLLPIYRPLEYFAVVAVAAIVYTLSRRVFKDATIRVDLPPDTGSADADHLLSEARQMLGDFRLANDHIADEKVSACIVEIEASAVQILARLEEQPALYSQLRTFLRYYLPTTKKLLDARAQLEQGGMFTENAKEVCARTDRVLPEIQRAFEKQLEALDKHRYLDLDVEIDVLEGMLKSDGLSK